MSMLGEQIKELRELAEAMHRRSHEIGLDYGMGRELANASRILREAADTIERLRDRLQELQGVCGESEKQVLSKFRLWGAEVKLHEGVERTCKNKSKSCTSFWCSKCDAATSDGFADVGGKLARFNYCPNCSAKVTG